MVVAVGEGLVGPAVLVADAMVVPAEWREVLDLGWSAPGPWVAVV